MEKPENSTSILEHTNRLTCVSVVWGKYTKTKLKFGLAPPLTSQVCRTLGPRCQEHLVYQSKVPPPLPYLTHSLHPKGRLINQVISSYEELPSNLPSSLSSVWYLTSHPYQNLYLKTCFFLVPKISVPKRNPMSIVSIIALTYIISFRLKILNLLI